MNAATIATGAPLWVYALLGVLVLLGVRRLRTREVPVAVALIPLVAFLGWSIVGAAGFAARAGVGIAALAWLSGVAVGAASGAVLPDPRTLRLPGGRVRQPASWLPLILYIIVFVGRFACGAWAAVVPAQAIVATALGVAIGAALTGRLIVALLRWQPVASAATTA